jgi:type IV pilus assembly protein PilW
MNTTRPLAIRKRRPSQCGFTLVELMISILIGLFLVGGLLTLTSAMKRTSGSQTGLSNLQENERMAMTLMTDVIQSAGYYPNPTVSSAATALPVTGVFTFGGQSVYGTGAFNAASPFDSITVRYRTGGTAANDNTINCTGNTSAAATTYVNVFSWDPTTGDLLCSLNGATAVHIASGLTRLQIYYGVQTNVTTTATSIDGYLDAAAVTAGSYWGNVISVKVYLTFTNPLYRTTAGTIVAGQPATIQFIRVINIMNKAGVNT